MAPVSRLQAVLTVSALASLVAILIFTVVSLGGPGAMMREAMGSSASMDDDMGMAGAEWWWVPLVAIAGIALWVVSRRRRHP